MTPGPEALAPERPPFRREILDIAPYPLGMSEAEAVRRYRRSDFVRLQSNESPLGPSPAALDAAREALARTGVYPDPMANALRAMLGTHLGVSADRVIAGPGSEAIIELFMRAVLGPGDEVLTASPTFPIYRLFARAQGASIHEVAPSATLELDPDALIAGLGRRPRMLCLCTPNNPTGDGCSRSDLERILSAASHDTVILLDEAYFEFGDRENLLRSLEDWGGTFLLARTFSKAYGLAALRAGYAILSSAQLVAALDRVRPVFWISAAAQAAACAAFADQAHMERTVAMVRAERGRLESALGARNLPYIASQANFVMVRCRRPSREVANDLMQVGIMVHANPALADWLRISIGTPAANARMIAALPLLEVTE